MVAVQVDSSDPQALKSPHGLDFLIWTRGGVNFDRIERNTFGWEWKLKRKISQLFAGGPE